jgi:hypothetical protein
MLIWITVTAKGIETARGYCGLDESKENVAP